MNGRIKELHNKVVSESENMRWNIEDSERLTKLIVRKCADIVASSSLPDAYSEPCLAVIAEEIKEHFGVE
jgi:hypothetical protein